VPPISEDERRLRSIVEFCSGSRAPVRMRRDRSFAAKLQPPAGEYPVLKVKRS